METQDGKWCNSDLHVLCGMLGDLLVKLSFPAHRANTSRNHSVLHNTRPARTVPSDSGADFEFEFGMLICLGTARLHLLATPLA
eukprot:2121700-Rhodomonas_salina.3